MTDKSVSTVNFYTSRVTCQPNAKYFIVLLDFYLANTDLFLIRISDSDTDLFHFCPPTGEALLGVVMYVPCLNFKIIISHIEEETMSLSVFYYCICAFFLSVSQFQLNFVSFTHISAVLCCCSRPCCLSEFTLTEPH